MSVLPPDVLDALRSGQTIEAIKRLRAAGLGLKEAKDAIDAHQAEAPTNFGGFAADGSMPQAAIDALREGSKIEAIRLVREHTGLGLKAAKDMVDGYERQMPDAARGRLSPGEVGRGVGVLPWVIGAVALAALAYFFLP